MTPHHQTRKRVEQIDINQITTIDDLIDQWSQSNVFAGGKLAQAVKILKTSKAENANILVGLAGAMVPGGMRKVISQAIRDGNIQALTTTGANITHDIIEAIVSVNSTIIPLGL